jgi:aminopeptidase N
MDRHYTHANSMFDGRTYPKGAWVLHMLRNQLGEEAFWTGFRRYATEHKFQSVETVDFRRSLEHATGRDLERFFYDWLERPGNPDLEVTTEYEAGNQQAAITVKQTQQGEPFQFPLTIVLHQTGSSVPVVVAQQITEKEISLRIPLAGLLTRVDVDPDLAVLTELKENKTRDLWRAQLLEGQGVPARLRAAHHFAASKSDQDRELLARAFAGEKFWAVKIELAKALGGTGAIVSRTALLDGLQNDDARVRRACVDSLGSFKGDGAAVKAITEILQKGDPSYAVEAAALKAYAKLGQEDAIATITPWLSKPSHQNVLAVAALEALGTTQLKPALSILLQWAAPGHAANLRRAAQGALAQMAQSKIVTDAERRHIVKLIIKDLEESRGFGRLSALGALATLGPVAAAELPVVEKIFAESPEGLMHMIAEGIVNGMRQSAKAQSRPAAPPAEANQLREEVTRLNVEKEELRKRLEKYEKAGAAK